jgi:hypothetical protein
MKKIHLLTGPVLFLIAEVILPGGSAEVDARIKLIQNNATAWESGHLLIAIAFVFLLMWVAELYAYVRQKSALTAYAGLLFSTFALAADYGVGTLQLLSLDLVRAKPVELAQPVLSIIAQSPSLLGFVFLPTLGFAIGFGFLALAYFRATRQALPAVLLAAAGLLIAVAGLIQLKVLFVAGALALLAFAVWYIRPNK